MCCPYDDEGMEAFFGSRRWKAASNKAGMRMDMTKKRKGTHSEAARKAADTRQHGGGPKARRSATDEAIAQAMAKLAREERTRGEDK